MNVLNQKVLVLNKFWKPIRIIELRQAIVKLMSNATAKILEDCVMYTWEEWEKLEVIPGEPAISSSYRKYKVPSIIITNSAMHYFKHTPKLSRETIFKRDNYTCQYCGMKPERKLLSIDHIIPRSKGGITSWTNCVTSCKSCNFKKQNLTLEKSNMHLLCEPHKPKISLFQIEITNEKWKIFFKEFNY